MDFATKLAAFDAATSNELHDAVYGWMGSYVETQETIQNFVDASANCWAESTNAKHGEIAGLKFCAWKQMQARRGDTSDSCTVIDFGDRRAVINFDLTNFI